MTQENILQNYDQIISQEAKLPLMVKKIVIIGPESTGKSTLSQQLAQQYNTLWVPEFARNYLLANGMNYSYDDLLTIAKGQILLEDEYLQLLNDRKSMTDKSQLPLATSKSLTGDRWQMTGEPHSRLTTHDSRLLFIDTDMYVMKVWCEFVFERCHRWILDQIVERKYDLYLLCNIDLPWVEDELREYPDHEPRLRLYNMYKDLLINQSVPWIEISGDQNQRLQKAMGSIDKHLNN